MTLTESVGEAIADRPISVTVYRRIDPPIARASTEAIGRIIDLVNRGLIQEFDDVIVPSRRYTPEHVALQQTVADELDIAADRLGVTLEPAKQTINRYNQYTETDEQIDVLPAVTVVVKDAGDDSILAVAPVRMGDTYLRVEDLLDTLIDISA